jgi:hypothetical protein
LLKEYRTFGARLFWRSYLFNLTKGKLPRRFEPAREIHDRLISLHAKEVLRD